MLLSEATEGWASYTFRPNATNSLLGYALQIKTMRPKKIGLKCKMCLIFSDCAHHTLHNLQSNQTGSDLYRLKIGAKIYAKCSSPDLTMHLGNMFYLILWEHTKQLMTMADEQYESLPIPIVSVVDHHSNYFHSNFSFSK